LILKLKFGKLNKTTKGDLPMKSKKQYIFSQWQLDFLEQPMPRVLIYKTIAIV